MNAPAPSNPLFDYGAFLRPDEFLPESVLETQAFIDLDAEFEAELSRLQTLYADWTTANAAKVRR